MLIKLMSTTFGDIRQNACHKVQSNHVCTSTVRLFPLLWQQLKVFLDVSHQEALATSLQVFVPLKPVGQAGSTEAPISQSTGTGSRCWSRGGNIKRRKINYLFMASHGKRSGSQVVEPMCTAMDQVAHNQPAHDATRTAQG